MTRGKTTRPVEEDAAVFWAHVEKRGPDDCWEWTGTLTGNAGQSRGYGLSRYQGRQMHASRVSWLLNKGPIPEGLWVLHRCDNPPCCNPAHLFLGTQSDNTRDMLAKGRGRHGPLPVRLGEENPTAKLTERQAQEIRALYIGRGRGPGAPMGGPSQRAIADRFGVSEACVRKVLRGKTWRGVSA